MGDLMWFVGSMLIFRELYHFSFQGTPCSSPLPSLPPNTPDSFPRRPQGRQAQHQGRSNPLPCAIAEASEKKRKETPWKMNGWFTYKSPMKRFRKMIWYEPNMILFYVNLQGCNGTWTRKLANPRYFWVDWVLMLVVFQLVGGTHQKN